MIVPVKIALALAACLLFAQEEPLVRVETQMVEVDVVVSGKNGPVADLTKDDFVVFDEGHRQSIAAFAIRSTQTRPLNNKPVDPGIVSNRAKGFSTTVFLFDALNTADQVAGHPVSPQAQMRLQALKYLQTAEKGDQYAVYTLSKSLKVIENFTDDIPRVTRAVDRAWPEHSPDQGADDFGDDVIAMQRKLKDPIADAMQKNAVKEMEDAALKNRALITAEAMETIARYLQGQPGRKKLVWLSASFPAIRIDQRDRNGQTLIEKQEFGLEIAHAVRALNDGNVAVYPIDPRDAYNAGLPAEGIDTMNLFAKGTGGKAYYNVEDIADAIRKAVQDSEVTYALGYYPQDVRLDGRYHKLSVKVDRDGVDVRSREGYYATDLKPLSEKQRHDSVLAIMDSPLDATGIGLNARVRPLRGKADSYDLELTIDLNQIHLDREGNRWVASIDCFTYFPKAKKQNGTEQSLKITLTDDRLRESLTKGYTMHREWDAPVERMGDLRIVVQDRVTGTAGSVRLRVPPG